MIHIPRCPSDSGAKLAFSDVRRLGRLRLVTGDPFTQPPLSDLGRDVLNEPLSLEMFATGARTSFAAAALYPRRAYVAPSPWDGVGLLSCSVVNPRSHGRP